MAIGFPGGGLFGRSGQGAAPLSQLFQMAGPPDMDYDQFNSLLQAYGGLGLQNQPQSGMAPGGLFESIPALTKRAPGIAQGFDNALIALANMGPTGATAGDNISNVARGLSAIGPTRRMQAAAPVMLQLEMAGKIAQLQAQGEYMKYLKSMSDYYGNRDQTQLQVQQLKNQAAAEKQTLLSGKELTLLKDGTVGVPDLDDDGKLVYRSDPSIDPKSIQRNAMLKQFGGGIEGTLTLGKAGPMPNPSDPYAPENAAWWSHAGNIFKDFKSAGAQTSAGAAGDRQRVGDFFQSQKSIYSDIKSGNTSAAVRAKNLKSRTTELFMGMDPNDPNAYSKALGQAQQEQQQHLGRIDQAWNSFSLLDPATQQKAGGFVGYLQNQGYNPQTDQFTTGPTNIQDSARPAMNRAQPQTRTLGSPNATQQNPTPRARPTAANPQAPNVSPNVDALIRLMQQPATQPQQ